MSIENMRHKGIIDQWARRHNGPAPQGSMMEKPSRASRSGRRRITQRRLLHPSTRGRRRRTGKPSGKSAGMPLACFLCRGAHWMSAGFATQTPSPWSTRKKRRLASCLRVSRLPSWRIKRGSGVGLASPVTFSQAAGCGRRRGSLFSRAVSAASRYLVWGNIDNYAAQKICDRRRGFAARAPRHLDEAQEIGRASCRERVLRLV